MVRPKQDRVLPLIFGTILNLCLNTNLAIAEEADANRKEKKNSIEQSNSSQNDATMELAPLEVIGNGMDGFGYSAVNASTATKTDTPIMEIPQAIQVLPEAVIIDQDLQNTSSALENVSSIVAPKSTELLTTEFIVRGFKSQVYLDGMPAFNSGNVTDPLSLVNVQRIEVAKGPTATLFGGGLGAPIGGLINIVSKEPMQDREYTFGFRGGSFATINPFFDFNQPITEDKKVLFRVTGKYENSESFIDKLENEQFVINPTLSVDFTDDTRLVVRGQYSHIKFLAHLRDLYSQFPNISTS